MVTDVCVELDHGWGLQQHCAYVVGCVILHLLQLGDPHVGRLHKKVKFLHALGCFLENLFLLVEVLELLDPAFDRAVLSRQPLLEEVADLVDLVHREPHAAPLAPGVELALILALLDVALVQQTVLETEQRAEQLRGTFADLGTHLLRKRE